MLTLSHWIVSHYCSMSLGKVCLLGEIPVQVLAEVSRLQERSFCGTFYLDTVALLWAKPCETHQTFHCPCENVQLESLPWKQLLGKWTLTFERKYYWRSCLVQKGEVWNEREDLLTGHYWGYRMGMQRKKDHGQDTGAARRKRNTAVLQLGVREKGSLLHDASVYILSNIFVF